MTETIKKLCEVPIELHPIAESAMREWIEGKITGLEFLRYAMLVDSTSEPWVQCILDAGRFAFAGA